ncbi:MAG: hypothetical protein HOP34_13260, partial [Methylococcaceae bacterium]|nr:hypothetical protein [Methylococcaceae bacterium]
MSAQMVDVGELSGARRLSVSFRVLLGLYAIIPVCLLLQVFDGWFWQGFLKAHLPSSPNHFLLFQILFGTPHILASTLLLATNAEYVQRYQRNLLVMTAAIAVFFGVGSLFIPYRVFYVLVAGWTVFHVLKQQHGIGRGVCRLPSWAFYYLLCISVAAGLLIYIGIFLKNSLEPSQVLLIKESAGVLCALLFVSALYIQQL